MRKINISSLKMAGLALLSGAFAFGGCKSNGIGEHIAPPAVALAQPVATPKPTPTAKPTPAPTPLHKGIALFDVKTKKKVFALTFDDGPDPTYTPRVLKILKQKNAPATFFMIGKMVRAHAATGMLVVKAGYPIGNHTWTHPMHPRDPRGEIERTDAIIEKNLGLTPHLFRPPYGIRNNGLASVASARGEDVILWSSDSDDWNRGTSVATIHNNVMKNARPGGIAIMHDGGGNRSATVAALPGIINSLRARGFTLVTVPELMKIGQPDTARIGAKKPKAKAKQTSPKKPATH